MPVIFDLDGTLVDSAPDLRAACVKMLRAEGKPAPSLQTVIGYIGNGIPRLVQRAMDDHGIAPDQHPRLLTAYRAHYDAAPANLSRLYPNVPELLRHLHARGHKMAICTNKPADPARQLLAALGIEAFFPVLVGGDSLSVKKPDPAPLRDCLRQLGETRCLYVGDSEVDAQTAQNADQPLALFRGGYRKASVSELPHRFAFDNFAQLQGFVDHFSDDG
ncbi:MAG: phosphoglycolate phosphatase [Rhodobacterales bacterium]|nr:MAG: phosphoglycolate phosphatase [Rhodobacterales bacterium]